jgi:hypothetical protein
MRINKFMRKQEITRTVTMLYSLRTSGGEVTAPIAILSTLITSSWVRLFLALAF